MSGEGDSDAEDDDAPTDESEEEALEKEGRANFSDLLDRIEGHGSPREVDEPNDRPLEDLMPGDEGEPSNEPFTRSAADRDEVIDRDEGSESSPAAGESEASDLSKGNEADSQPDADPDADEVSLEEVTDRLPTSSDDDDDIPEASTARESEPGTAMDALDDEDRDTSEGPAGLFVGEDAEPTHATEFDDLLGRIAKATPITEAESTPSPETPTTSTQLEEIGAFEPGVNLLILGGEQGFCHEVLSGFRLDRTDMFLVWLGRRLDRRIDGLLTALEARPRRLAIVCERDAIDDIGSDPEVAEEHRDAVSIHRVQDGQNLTQLGIAISRGLKDWEDRDRSLAVCFDSITSLLRFREPERVFQFVHLLQDRLDNVDATAHFHMNSQTHELHTISTFREIFDATIEVTEDGVIEL